jgi:hypothetical protein
LFPASRSSIALANAFAEVHARNVFRSRSSATRAEWLFSGRSDRKYQQRF